MVFYQGAAGWQRSVAHNDNVPGDGQRLAVSGAYTGEHGVSARNATTKTRERGKRLAWEPSPTPSDYCGEHAHFYLFQPAGAIACAASLRIFWAVPALFGISTLANYSGYQT